MLKEIVEFSKELEREGIYDRIREQNQIIDKPIMVIPIKDDLSGFDTDGIYFVVKDIKNLSIKDEKTEELIERNHLILDNNKYEIKNEGEFKKIRFLKIDNIVNEHWKEILKNLNNYTSKVFGSNFNIDRIGGISSYNIFIFTFIVNKKLSDILNKTYSKNNEDFSKLFDYIPNEEKYIDNTANDRSREILNNYNRVVKYFQKNKKEIIKIFSEIHEIFSDVDKTIEILQRINDDLKSISILFYFNSEVNIYSCVYRNHLENKIFYTDEFLTKEGSCSSCSIPANESYLSFPTLFNNLNIYKPFLKHLNRLNNVNIALCSNCVLYINEFRYLFLQRLNIKIFPIIINKDTKYEINILKNNFDKIQKDTFRKIITSFYQETNLSELDYYLVIYDYTKNQQGIKDSFYYFDYITGFKYNFKGINIFHIENLLERNFFNKYNNSYNEAQLIKNYFSSEINTGIKQLDNLLYRYRIQIFDFIYRAKYNSLSLKDIASIYFESLQLKLKDFYSPDLQEKIILQKIGGMNNAYNELDKLFGGHFMETVEKIKEIKDIVDINSFAYYAGQIVFFLLSKSGKSDKKHSMAEPFINLRKLSMLALKLEELFNAYKHNINLHDGKFNVMFSKIWSYLVDHKNDDFKDELKMMFYAGYFDSNIFYEKKQQNTGENNEAEQK